MDILTYTGIYMDPLAPKPEQLSLSDMAHALSMLCRANGHFPEVHTVAQHCIECCEEAKARGLSENLQLFCLLHDSSEAYLGDFIHPVKARMEGFKEAEDHLLAMIYEKYAGRCPTKDEEKVIKELDRTLRHYEFLHYMGEGTGYPGQGLKSRPVFKEIPRQEVEERYLALYEELASAAEGRYKTQ